jgi:hypothetical protein
MTCICNDIPDGKETVKNKWLLMAKESPNRSTNQYNAWLVAKGFTLEYGVDCDYTFSSVIQNSSLRLLPALAAEMDVDIYHLAVIIIFIMGTWKM